MREYLHDCSEGNGIAWSDGDEQKSYNRWGKPDGMAPLDVIQHLGGDLAPDASLVERVKCRRLNPTVVVARKLVNIVNSDFQKHGTAEIKCLKGLRHPHIIALVGAYLDIQQIGILLYPAAEWNLTNFMECHEPTQLEDPGRTTYHTKRYYLRRYFVCLSRALEFLHHTANIRHKDIKPRNVLVDSFGNVLLSDFGLSRKYRNAAESRTRTETYTSYEYSTPEFIEKRKRGPESDIFGLGLIFAEMATMVLGRSLKEFREYRTSKSLESGEDDVSYHANLRAVRRWLTEELQSTRRQDDICAGQDQMRRALPTILRMISRKESLRGSSKDLWENFQDINTRRCPDCDPREETAWPTTQRPLSEADIQKFGFWDDISQKSVVSDRSARNTTQLSQRSDSSNGHATESASSAGHLIGNGTLVQTPERRESGIPSQTSLMNNFPPEETPEGRVIVYDVKEEELEYRKYKLFRSKIQWSEIITKALLIAY